ncbi:MAG: hypothetical protein H6560_27720 [Lewinellaceae bacterium]|nr:hypothetical protein [Lewinellaceae bacterium]
MNRTLILLIAFLLLGGGVFWYFSQGEDEKTTLLSADRTFAVEDINQVYKIFIADRRGERTTLERRDGYWLYNGQYKALPSVMRNRCSMPSPGCRSSTSPAGSCRVDGGVPGY